MWLTDGSRSGGCWQGAPCRLPRRIATFLFALPVSVAGWWRFLFFCQVSVTELLLASVTKHMWAALATLIWGHALGCGHDHKESECLRWCVVSWIMNPKDSHPHNLWINIFIPYVAKGTSPIWLSWDGEVTPDDYPGGLDVITRILRGSRRSQLEKEMCVTERQSSKRCDHESRTEQPPETRQGKEQVLPESLPKEHGPVSTCTAAQCKGL